MTITTTGIWHEAQVTIEGQELSFAESMTLRVALSSFLSRMASDGLGDDEQGKALAKSYLAHGRKIESLIVDACNNAAAGNKNL